MFPAALEAIALIATPAGIMYLMFGCVLGLIFGLLPGLGAITALVLLFPFTFGLQPTSAMLMIGGIMGGASFGGAITAILLNTPGMAPNAATCFDGYPMAQKGEAGKAIGAAGAASSLGGLFGVVILIAILPLAQSIILAFGPAEFFVLAILGLCAIAVATEGLFLRGLAVGGVGILLGTIGEDPMMGVPRFTGGWLYFYDGLPLIPALIGIFGVCEMLRLSARGGVIAQNPAALDKISGVGAGVLSVFTHWRTLLQGSVIGAVIGIIPGLGGTVASFLSYAFARQSSKDPDSFGKGNIEGVIAPEAANNAKDGGSLIPTLAFGIPGSVEVGILLGMFILHGIQPGPLMLVEHADVVLSLIMALAASCVLATIIGLMFVRPLAALTRMPVRILAPVFISLALVGSYALHRQIEDVVVTAIFGVIGWLMLRFEVSRLSLIIGMILANIAERSFRQSMAINDNNAGIFIERPVSLTLIILTVALVGWSLVRNIRASSRKRNEHGVAK